MKIILILLGGSSLSILIGWACAMMSIKKSPKSPKQKASSCDDAE